MLNQRKKQMQVAVSDFIYAAFANQKTMMVFIEIREGFVVKQGIKKMA